MPKRRIYLDEVNPNVIYADNIRINKPDTTDIEYPNFVFSRNNPNFGLRTGLGYNMHGQMIDYNNNGVLANKDYIINKIRNNYYKTPSQRRVNAAKKVIETNNRTRKEIGGSGMSQNDLWKAANDLVITPKANMTRSQYNYHSAYDGDSLKGAIMSVPGVGDAATMVDLADQYINNNDTATANKNTATTAALTGLSKVKVRGIPVGNMLSRGYTAITNMFR